MKKLLYSECIFLMSASWSIFVSSDVTSSTPSLFHSSPSALTSCCFCIPHVCVHFLSLMLLASVHHPDFMAHHVKASGSCSTGLLSLSITNKYIYFTLICTPHLPWIPAQRLAAVACPLVQAFWPKYGNDRAFILVGCVQNRAERDFEMRRQRRKFENLTLVACRRQHFRVFCMSFLVF